MKSCLFRVLLAGFLQLFFPHIVLAEAAMPFVLSIVPTSSTEKGGPALELYGSQGTFDVILTNKSHVPQKVWMEWCSWGYFSLSFIMTDENGNQSFVNKLERAWDKNFPAYYLVGPNEHYVYHVSLSSLTWSNPPLPKQGLNRKFKITAIYEVKETPESKKEGVWVGKIYSLGKLFTVYR